MQPLISVEDLSREYRLRKPPANFAERLTHLVRPKYTVALPVQNVSFQISSGECVGLIGPNGAGKSTTIKLLTGILKPTRGQIEVDGYQPHRDRLKYVRRIGVIFGQRSQLWANLPVMDSFNLLRAMFDVPQDAFTERLALFKNRVGVGEFLGRTAGSLSLGQRMLCEITATFLHGPKIVFLDEPTIGLDIEMKDRVRQLIRVINQEFGTTIIITSHDVGDIDKLANRLLVIDRGKLRYDGTLSDFKNKVGDGRWCAVRVERSRLTAALAAINTQMDTPPGAIRERDGWIEIAQHHGEALTARAMRTLSNFDVLELKHVEHELEDLLHKYYTQLKDSHA